MRNAQEPAFQVHAGNSMSKASPREAREDRRPWFDVAPTLAGKTDAEELAMADELTAVDLVLPLCESAAS